MSVVCQLRQASDCGRSSIGEDNESRPRPCQRRPRYGAPNRLGSWNPRTIREPRILLDRVRQMRSLSLRRAAPPTQRFVLVVVSSLNILDQIFASAVAPILPYYADRLHLSKASYAVGILVSAFPAGVFVGWLGRKRTILFGLTLLGLSSIGFGFATNVIELDLTRGAQGCSASLMWAGGMTWLVDITATDRRGTVIGAMAGLVAGFGLLGPVVGALASVIGTRVVFGTIAAVAAVESIVVIRTEIIEAKTTTIRAFANLAMAVSDLQLLAAWWLIVLRYLYYGVISVLVPLQMHALGASPAAIAASFLVASATATIVIPLVGRGADRHWTVALLYGGLLSSAAVVLGLRFAGAIWVIAASVIGAEVCTSVFSIAAHAFVSTRAQVRAIPQGVAFAMISFAFAVGSITGSAGGGSLAQLTTDGVPYLCLVVLLLAGLLCPRALSRATQLPSPSRRDQLWTGDRSR